MTVTGIKEEVSWISVERIKGILKDIVWIGIGSYLDGPLGHPVKLLINTMLKEGSNDMALRMAASVRGKIPLCTGLDLYWLHVYKENRNEVVIEFTISGSDANECEYITTIEDLQDYFNHLSSTGSRTF